MPVLRWPQSRSSSGTPGDTSQSQEKYLEGFITKPKRVHHVPPSKHSHLHVLDAITIGVIVTLVPDAVVVGVLLPRVRCQTAVVLQAPTALEMGRRHTAQHPEDAAPPSRTPTCLQCLLLSMQGRGSSG